MEDQDPKEIPGDVENLGALGDFWLDSRVDTHSLRKLSRARAGHVTINVFNFLGPISVIQNSRNARIQNIMKNTLGPAPTLKIGLFYAVISFAALAIAGVAAWFMVGHLDTLARYMAIERAFFVLLVVVALGAAAFLFGAMRSYGSISGNRFGTAFEFGGPAALAVMIILGGMELPSSVKPFDLTVRFLGMQQVTPEDKADIDLGVRHEVWAIGPFGDVVIRGVDPKVMSQRINIGLISKSWRIKNPEKDYAIPSDALIRIETIPVALPAPAPAPQSRCSDFTGIYDVINIGGGYKGRAACPGAPIPCRLYNGAGTAELLPDSSSNDIHRWIVEPLDSHWSRGTVTDSTQCTQLTFSDGTIWKK